MMKMIICKRCGKKTKRTGTNQKYCGLCAASPEYRNKYAKKWREKQGVRLIKSQRRWYQKHKKQVLERSRIWQKKNPEHNIIHGHCYAIFKSKNISHKCYKGVPFFDGWNPSKGGSIASGVKWVIENIGKRPKKGKWNLHIVDRRIGFMPGNIMWVAIDRHRREEMFNRILLENSRLRKRLKGTLRTIRGQR